MNRATAGKYSPINLRQKLDKFADRWAPKVVAEMNDYQFKLVKIQGEFVWHRHADTDEVFIVLDGALTIELRDGRVELSAGEMFVVPKGVEHRPRAAAECKIMLVEPRGVVNTGDAGGAYTAPSDVWI
jgi:mannose-6-phosphate isomerase-like protein (cupin superfamily)